LQPPMPLHSFLPLHSCLADADAHPPLPLHAFFPSAPWPLQALWPLQTWTSALASFASAFFAGAAFSSAKALLPPSIPPATTPITFVNSLRSIQSLLNVYRSAPRHVPSDRLVRVFWSVSLCSLSRPVVKCVRRSPHARSTRLTPRMDGRWPEQRRGGAS